MKDLERENFLKHIPVGEYRINLFVLMRHDILNVSVSHVVEDICDSLRSNNTLNLARSRFKNTYRKILEVISSENWSLDNPLASLGTWPRIP